MQGRGLFVWAVAFLSYLSFSQPVHWGCYSLEDAAYYAFGHDYPEFIFLKASGTPYLNLYLYRSTQWVNASDNIINRGKFNDVNLTDFFLDVENFKLTKIDSNRYLVVGETSYPGPDDLKLLVFNLEPFVPRIDVMYSKYVGFNYNYFSVAAFPYSTDSLLWIIGYYFPGYNHSGSATELIFTKVPSTAGNPGQITAYHIDTTKFIVFYAYNAVQLPDSTVLIYGFIRPLGTTKFHGAIAIYDLKNPSNGIGGMMYNFDTTITQYVFISNLSLLNDSILLAHFSYKTDTSNGTGIALLNRFSLIPYQIWKVSNRRDLSSVVCSDTSFYLVENQDTGFVVMKIGLSGKLISSAFVKRNYTIDYLIRDLWVDPYGNLWVNFNSRDTINNKLIHTIYVHAPDHEKNANRCCDIFVNTVNRSLTPLQWTYVMFDTLLKAGAVYADTVIYTTHNIIGTLDNNLPPSFWSCGLLQYYEPVYVTKPQNIDNSKVQVYIKNNAVYVITSDNLQYDVQIYSLDGQLIKAKHCSSNKICQINLPKGISGMILVNTSFSDGSMETHKILIWNE